MWHYEAGGGELLLQPAPRRGDAQVATRVWWPDSALASRPSPQGPWPLTGNRGTQDPTARGHTLHYFPRKMLQVLRGSTVPDVPRRKDRRARWVCLSSSFSDLGFHLGAGGWVGGAFLKRLLLCRDNAQHIGNNKSWKGLSLSLCPGVMAQTQEQGAQPSACLLMPLANNW